MVPYSGWRLVLSNVFHRFPGGEQLGYVSKFGWEPPDNLVDVDAEKSQFRLGPRPPPRLHVVGVLRNGRPPFDGFAGLPDCNRCGQRVHRGPRAALFSQGRSQYAGGTIAANVRGVRDDGCACGIVLVTMAQVMQDELLLHVLTGMAELCEAAARP
jgi:hypothetical protein